MFGPHTKTQSISIHKLKTNNFRPAHKTELDFDPRTKKVKFDPDAKTNSISFPHIKTRVISTPSLKPS